MEVPLFGGGLLPPVDIHGTQYGPEQQFVTWEESAEGYKYSGWWRPKNNWQGHWTDGSSGQSIWLAWWAG